MNLQSIQRMFEPPKVVKLNPLDNISQDKKLKLKERREAIIDMLSIGEMFIYEIYTRLNISDRTAYDDVNALISQGKVRAYKKRVFDDTGPYKGVRSTTRTVVKLL